MNAKRAFLLLLIFTFVFILLGVKLFDIQIVDKDKLSRAASSQRTARLEIEKLRGDILDRNLIPFTNRNKKFLVILKPFLLQGHEDVIRGVCNILDLDFLNVMSKMTFRREPLIIETDENRKNSILNLQYEGVSVVNSLQRYDRNTIARHVLGYISKADGVGETGIEKFYNDALTYNSENVVAVVTDGDNNVLPGMGYRILKSQGSNKKLDVKLTLDYHIQSIVEDVMEGNNITGAVVVEEVNSGDIVAISSKPDFDSNKIENYINSSQKELFNRAVASYNLGSIFKIIDAAVMLETADDWEDEYFCSGSITLGDREFKCYSYDSGGHGYVDLNKAFALSCNTYFINTTLKMNIKTIIEKAQQFGLGNITGIKKQGIDESKGNIPLIGNYFTDGDIANISIGQGEIMATPIQVADMVATIANGGIKNQINIVDSVVDENGCKVRELRVKKGERIIEKDVADKIKVIMEKVIDEGTGTMIKLDEYGGSAGKTGSAETGQYINGQRIVHAWFAGYFPRRSPKYSIAVFVENGRMGGAAAGPIFQEIAKRIMEKGY